MRFAKGHGTGNDFVILPDPEGSLQLSPRLVAALCDRRTGIGADGVLRVVRAEACLQAGDAGEAEWFMDYRNADGSLAEMCGNGIRVFARFLVESGLSAPGELAIATRAGVRSVELGDGGDVAVDMGPAEVLGKAEVRISERSLDGLWVSVGNPHVACLVDEPVEDWALSTPPNVDPLCFPDGVNIEIFRPIGPQHIAMRVYERGSGETRSCGTGAVAAAMAAAQATGEPAGSWAVDTPGGRLTVTFAEGTTLLSGAAVLVAEGELHPGWLASL